MTASNRHIVWLDEAEGKWALVGSKAANLGRLLASGLPVADGFCITTETWADVLPGVNQVPSLLPALQREIVEAYRVLGARDGENARVAVRSSALVEDLPNASFAGLFASVLNVAGEDELLEAVRQCWAAAFSRQVGAYRAQHELGPPGEQVELAVIVQLMVPADFAGVLFTLDPLTGDESQLLVEVVPGTGDKVASGTQVPLHLRIDKWTGAVSFATPAPSSDLVDLERIDWQPLLELALQVEELFQLPQDIEWAYSEQQFWLLQSRPITAYSQRSCRQIWSRANVGEVLPGVISPLTWSLFKPILQKAGMYCARSPLTIHWRWEHPCGDWPDSPCLFQGRAYLELASAYRSFGGLPGIRPEILQRALGFEFDLCAPNELPEKRPRWHVMDPYRALCFWLEMLGLTGTLPRRARRWLRREKSSDDRSAPADALDVQSEAILDRVDRLQRETARIFGLHLQSTAMAFSALGLLNRLVGRYVEPETVQRFEAGLVAGFHDVGPVQQGIAIWDLAQAARGVHQVAQSLFAPEALESPDHVVEAWRRSPEVADFMCLWDSFMVRFGDRGTREFELAMAHWDDDPSFVLQTMREILRFQWSDPRERLNQQQEAGRHSTQRMLERIRSEGSFWDVWFFERLVDAHREYVSLRENLKYSVISRFNALRKQFVALGELLERSGVLEDGDDIFFLQYEEIVDLIRGFPSATFAVGALVAGRKREREKYAQSSVPDVWVTMDGRCMPVDLPGGRKGDAVLRGIGCSRGRVTGPACVLASVGDEPTMGRDQILVLPSIDPGLTPLLLTAAGLVTELGGVLSHGATVAREFGLPAVVGVPHATRRIRNGQQITVDGDMGLVHLGPPPGE